MMLEIEPIGSGQLSLLAEHIARHVAESGQGELHFVPYLPGVTGSGPRPLDPRRFELPLNEPGWQRAFAALSPDGKSFVGHVDLKGDGIHTGLHRCELGIGIERGYRGSGLGRRLMQCAIDFTRQAPSIVWLDLKVFGHNAPARALYRTLGFTEVGTVYDRFRIDGKPIDDVIMTLNVEAS